MKRSFYISLQTSCNEMLFCGIFISILNHINDSLSWRIRWEKKINIITICCFQLYCLEALPRRTPANLCSHGGWGHLQQSREFGVGCSTSHWTISSHCNCSHADDEERSSETAANSCKQAANKPTEGDSHLVLLTLSSAPKSLQFIALI